MNFPRTPEMQLYSSHFFSGAPGRKGQVRKTGDKVTTATKSKPATTRNPRLMKHGHSHTGSMQQKQYCYFSARTPALALKIQKEREVASTGRGGCLPVTRQSSPGTRPSQPVPVQGVLELKGSSPVQPRAELITGA